MIKAFNNNLIIELIPLETKTAGGIYLPEKQKDRPQKGTVISSDVSEIKEGTKVLFRKYAGEPLKEDGRELKIVHIKDVIATYE